MDRRAFLLGTASRVGFVALTVLAVGSLAPPGVGQISAHLRRTFGYLTISDADLEAFASAYLDVHGPPLPGEWPRVEDTFLLSTNFFLDGADESIPVVFVAIYDPYASPCFNPLAAVDA